MCVPPGVGMSFMPGAAATYLVSGFLKMDVSRQPWVETEYPPTAPDSFYP